ncbi:insulin-like peptide 17 [Ditylenchus destructor]|uniref:Insulin-like peptide 17 n=1 Tax=Ditylenchus destructor TaxID=166010 RepID=A0AAD4QU96_9BILA|nr:insulin-like peptide 17 [Ditylenchus destructor]
MTVYAVPSCLYSSMKRPRWMSFLVRRVSIVVTFVLLILPPNVTPLPVSSANVFGQLHPLVTLLQDAKEEPRFGTLKLCPPGGRSFFEAFQLACPMRRKKRSVLRTEVTDQYRPATINEIMHICCRKGCEFTDFFPHCGPFADW